LQSLHCSFPLPTVTYLAGLPSITVFNGKAQKKASPQPDSVPPTITLFIRLGLLGFVVFLSNILYIHFITLTRQTPSLNHQKIIILINRLKKRFTTARYSHFLRTRQPIILRQNQNPSIKGIISSQFCIIEDLRLILFHHTAKLVIACEAT
jgi:hypothetical protein